MKAGYMKAGYAIALLLWVLSSAGLAAADDEDEGLVWTTKPDVRIDIEVVSGKIEIEGWDRDEVRLDADDDDAHKVEIDARNRRVTIRGPGVQRRGFAWGRGDLEVDVKLFVPRGSRIRASTMNGEIKVEDVDGTLDLNAANGKIEVEGGPSEARLETINSGIELEGRETHVDARTINGGIELTGVAGEVSASTISGSIKVEASEVERLDLKTLSGSIEIATRLAPDARAHLKTFSGEIRLELPSDTSARFEIQNFSGGIRNELATSAHHSSPRIGGQHLEFSTAEGDGRVSIESFSGAVEIRAQD